MFEIFSLKTDAFGLEITDYAVRVAQFKKNRNSIAGFRFNAVDLAPGIVKDGEIKNQSALARAIKGALVKKKNGINAKYAIISLPENKAFLKVIQMPRLSLDDLRIAVIYEAENHIPMSLEKVYLDFEVINNPQTPADHLDILLVATPRYVVDSYADAVRAAGLTPLAFEPESQAIVRSVIGERQKNAGSSLIIQIGDTKTSLIVYAADSLRFVFSIPISNHYFLETISKYLNVSQEQAQTLKATQGILAYAANQNDKQKSGKKNSKEKKIFEALIPGLVDFIQQVAKYTEYYKTHSSHEHGAGGEGRIGKAILCGCGANLSGLDEFISLKLNVPVIKGDSKVLANENILKFSQLLNNGISGSFIVAAGLAVRAMQASSQTTNLAN